MGLQERLVECVNIKGEPSLDCRERRPASRRRCAGSCIPYTDEATGWTRIVSTLPKENGGSKVKGQEAQLHNTVISQKQTDIYNESQKEIFLETKASNYARKDKSSLLSFLLAFSWNFK